MDSHSTTGSGRRTLSYSDRLHEGFLADFRITENEWVALLTDFRASLDKFKVPPNEQQELIAIVESTKTDIVVGAARPK